MIDHEKNAIRLEQNTTKLLDRIKGQKRTIKNMKDDYNRLGRVQKAKIEQLASALAVIQSEAERIQGGNGHVGHLIRCIHVQVNGAMSVCNTPEE